MYGLSKSMVILLLGIFLFVDQTVRAQETETGVRLGFCGEFSFGYHNIGSDDLTDFKKEGLGTVPQKSGIMIVSLGVDTYLYRRFQISFLGSWSHDEYQPYWKNALGSGEEVELNLNILDLRVEIQPLFPLLPAFPYFSVGRTMLYNLVDKEGDGFRDGAGDFFYAAGIDIPVPIWYSQGGFAGLRIGFIFRPSFAYKEFKIGESMPVEIEGKSLSLFVGFHFVSGLFM